MQKALTLIFIMCGILAGQVTIPPPAMEQAKQSDSFVDSIGVNTHFSYLNTTYGNAALMESELIQLGIRHARDGAGNQSISDGVYNTMKAVASTGTNFDLVFDPRTFPSWSQFDAQFASIGISSVFSVEGPIEYDISGDPNWQATLIPYQGTLYATTKGDSNPTIAALPVVLFSLIFNANDLSVENQSAYANFSNMHSYPGGNVPTTSMCCGSQTYISNANIVGSPLPIWATETGYQNDQSDSQGVSDAASGKYIPRIYLNYFNLGVPHTFIYEFADESNTPNDPQQNYGLITYNGTEKQAFTTTANMIKILSDKGATFVPNELAYSLSGSTSNVTHTLLQKRNGRFELVLWLEVASYNLANHTDLTVEPQPVTVNLNPTFSSYNLYDPSISSAVQSSGTSPTSIIVSVYDSPQILELIPFSANPSAPTNVTATVR